MVMSLSRAMAMDTWATSMAIHRRPQVSAWKGMAPEPQVRSSTRSPGSVVIRRHRSRTLGGVSTMYCLSCVVPTLAQIALTCRPGISSSYCFHLRVSVCVAIILFFCAMTCSPRRLTRQWLPAGHMYPLTWQLGPHLLPIGQFFVVSHSVEHECPSHAPECSGHGVPDSCR